MKIKTPFDRYDLSIKNNDYVLEVGPGHNPSRRSNVIVEKYLTDNANRCGELKIYPHQKLINAAGEDLPFEDKTFDYVICNQVLEHATNPENFLKEQSRVAKRGYIETPSLIGEYLFPKESHKWVILDLDNKLILFDKSKMPGNYLNNYGELFLNYLPYQSLVYRLLWLTEGNIMLNRYEWKDEIEYIINPTDEKYLKFFIQKWDREMVEKLFPKRSVTKEFNKLRKGLIYLLKCKIKYMISSKVAPLTYYEYEKLHKQQKIDA